MMTLLPTKSVTFRCHWGDSTSLTALSGSRISLCAQRRSGGGPPLFYWQAGGGDYIYSLLYTYTWLLGRLPNKVLQLLMWWRSQWPLGPAKEASYAALSSLPPPTLGLQHCLRPMVGTAIAPSGGRSFYSCITLTTVLFEEEHSGTVCTMLEPQRTSYGFAYCSPWSLGGLVHALAEVALLVIRLW